MGQGNIEGMSREARSGAADGYAARPLAFEVIAKSGKRYTKHLRKLHAPRFMEVGTAWANARFGERNWYMTARTLDLENDLWERHNEKVNDGGETK